MKCKKKGSKNNVVKSTNLFVSPLIILTGYKTQDNRKDSMILDLIKLV